MMREGEWRGNARGATLAVFFGSTFAFAFGALHFDVVAGGEASPPSSFPPQSPSSFQLSLMPAAPSLPLLSPRSMPMPIPIGSSFGTL